MDMEVRIPSPTEARPDISYDMIMGQCLEATRSLTSPVSGELRPAGGPLGMINHAAYEKTGVKLTLALARVGTEINQTVFNSAHQEGSLDNLSLDIVMTDGSAEERDAFVDWFTSRFKDAEGKNRVEIPSVTPQEPKPDELNIDRPVKREYSGSRMQGLYIEVATYKDGRRKVTLLGKNKLQERTKS